MFLSQLILNPRSRAVQRDLGDPYALHQTLARGWGDGATYTGARVLFRVEEAAKGAVLLVQSRTPPVWAALPDDYVLDAPRTKEWQPRFVEGQRLAFRLVANPTVKRDGKRWGLYDQHHQLLWLARKAAQHGFALPQMELEIGDESVSRPAVTVQALGTAVPEVRPDGQVVHFRRLQGVVGQRAKGSGQANGQKHAASFCAARFDGVLTVRDADAFTTAIEGGIGSGKAFGFGLLSIAKC